MLLPTMRAAALLAASLANVLLIVGCSRAAQPPAVACPTDSPLPGVQRPTPSIAKSSLRETNGVEYGVQYQIRAPVVTQRCWPYPQVTFAAGDEVRIAAQGCVQIGGRGKTRKRYVDPRGPNAETLYHALVSIPGVTDGLVRLQDVIDTPLVIPSGGTASRSLTLGFEDDFYPDNGYYDDDDAGFDCQCLGQHGPVVVTVTVRHASTTPSSPQPAVSPSFGPPQERGDFRAPMPSPATSAVNVPSCPPHTAPR